MDYKGSNNYFNAFQHLIIISMNYKGANNYFNAFLWVIIVKVKVGQKVNQGLNLLLIKARASLMTLQLLPH